MPPRWIRIPFRDRVRYTRPSPAGVEVASPSSTAERDPEGGNSRMDRYAIALSLLCGVHCFLTPILLLAMPTLGRAFGDARVHWGMALLVLPLATWAIGRGYRRHRRTVVPVLGAVGAVLVVGGLFVHSAAGAGSGSGFDDPASSASVDPHCCPVDAHADTIAPRPFPAHDAASLTTLAGSLFLVGAHGWNVRLCRCKECLTHDQH